jgi:hypothetical protein
MTTAIRAYRWGCYSVTYLHLSDETWFARRSSLSVREIAMHQYTIPRKSFFSQQRFNRYCCAFVQKITFPYKIPLINYITVPRSTSKTMWRHKFPSCVVAVVLWATRELVIKSQGWYCRGVDIQRQQYCHVTVGIGSRVVESYGVLVKIVAKYNVHLFTGHRHLSVPMVAQGRTWTTKQRKSEYSPSWVYCCLKLKRICNISWYKHVLYCSPPDNTIWIAEKALCRLDYLWCTVWFLRAMEIVLWVHFRMIAGLQQCLPIDHRT